MIFQSKLISQNIVLWIAIKFWQTLVANILFSSNTFTFHQTKFYLFVLWWMFGTIQRLTFPLVGSRIWISGDNPYYFYQSLFYEPFKVIMTTLFIETVITKNVIVYCLEFRLPWFGSWFRDIFSKFQLIKLLAILLTVFGQNPARALRSAFVEAAALCVCRRLFIWSLTDLLWP